MRQASSVLIKSGGDLAVNIDSFDLHIRAENLSPATLVAYVGAAKQFLCVLVRTNDSLLGVEHQDRVTNVIEKRLVRERTELVKLERNARIEVQRQEQCERQCCKWKIDRTDFEQNVADTDNKRHNCAHQ